MKVLIANLGSTSFKYRLFDMADERQLARGGVERIGSPESPCFVEIQGQRQEMKTPVPDHAVAVRQCLAQLTDPQLKRLFEAAGAKPAEVTGFAAALREKISELQAALKTN